MRADEIQIGQKIRHFRWPEGVYGIVKDRDGSAIMLNVPFVPNQNPAAAMQQSYANWLSIAELPNWHIVED